MGLAAAPYFHPQQLPHYQEDLQPLNARAIYVTPARGVEIQYVLSTFKYANNLYHVEMEKAVAIPLRSGERKKSLWAACSNSLSCRGKNTCSCRGGSVWGSGAARQRLPGGRSNSHRQSQGLHRKAPLNPLDVSLRFLVFDLVSMPPVSLLLNTQMQGEYYEVDDDLRIPAGMQYRFQRIVLRDRE
jgi:CRISPR-associated protein Csc1